MQRVGEVNMAGLRSRLDAAPQPRRDGQPRSRSRSPVRGSGSPRAGSPVAGSVDALTLAAQRASPTAEGGGDDGSLAGQIAALGAVSLAPSPPQDPAAAEELARLAALAGGVPVLGLGSEPLGDTFG